MNQWKSLKKFIVNILRISNCWESHYTGRGYIEGAGFDIKIKRLKIFNLSFITDIKIDVDAEWLRIRTSNMIKRGKQDALFKKK